MECERGQDLLRERIPQATDRDVPVVGRCSHEMKDRAERPDEPATWVNEPIRLLPRRWLPYGTAVRQAPASVVEGRVRGFPPALTSFVGRGDEVLKITRLLDEYRLVTVTGPGGVGKTRLTGEVARKVADQFPDGVWLTELAAVREPTLLPAAVASAMGVPQPPGVSVVDSLGGVLARKQLLLVLDNCEHLAQAVAELCGALLSAADDLRIIATSREPVGIAGEARYRLPPLTVLDDGNLNAGSSEAVTLFVDRARCVDPHFSLTNATGPMVAQLVKRLDGIPLAIELAAARVESLGLHQLLQRLDDRFALLGDANRTAAARHRSLAAAVDWSYHLLDEDERRVFRRLAIFPSSFTLEAAEEIAGGITGHAVLRLVDCSLLSPPHSGPDGRMRYAMLETLRAYGRNRLAEAGEQSEVAAALAAYTLRVVILATADMDTSIGEVAAVRWIDAEDVTVHQALAWSQQHDPVVALSVAIALAPWWQLRGRTVAGYASLLVAADQAGQGTETQSLAQLWLGHLAYSTHDNITALSHYEAVLSTATRDNPSRTVVGALIGRSSVLRNLDRMSEAVIDARRALDLARELAYPAGEVLALTELGLAAHYTGDGEALLERAREASLIDQALIPGAVVRRREYLMTIALFQDGQVDDAQHSCAVGLEQARESGDTQSQAAFLDAMIHMEVQLDRLSSAGTLLREAIEIALYTGDRLRLINCLDECGNLCAAVGRWAEAVTMWSAVSAFLAEAATPQMPKDAQGVTSVSVTQLAGRQASLRKARKALGSAGMQAAHKRGAIMTMKTATEFAIMLTNSDSGRPGAKLGTPQLSAREQELLTLVAQGCTDAQIAAKLYISLRTVTSHLDRIRDKTGCRRRPDLTRFALQAGLI
jgi:predicted ATPase/DNA-binding CsgD family transcriptional regulator